MKDDQEQHRMRVVCLIALLFLHWGCAFSTRTDDLQQPHDLSLFQATQLVRPATVQIVVHAIGLSLEKSKQLQWSGEWIPIGTGFIVNLEGYVLTARHVIKDAQTTLAEIRPHSEEAWMDVGLATAVVKDSRGNLFEHNFVGVDFDEIGEDVNNDLALLKLKLNPFKGEVVSDIPIIGQLPLSIGTVTFGVERPKQGAAIALSGYPFQKPTLVTNSGSIVHTSMNGTFKGNLLKDIYIANVVAHPGNSGGPAYSVESGVVIGVCVGVGRSDNVSGLIPARYAVELFKKHLVKWAELGN